MRRAKLPWLRDFGGPHFLKIVLEVLLVSMGVFLALLGDQWRENRHTRQVADSSLRRFHAEIVANRKAVRAVRDYHVTTLKALEKFLATDPKIRKVDDVQIRGLQPVFFEHTAWDLALATQSLANIDEQVAFSLSKVYGAQQAYADLTRGIIQTMYLRPVQESFDAYSYYYGDINLMEPELLRMYDDLVPQIEHVLGDSPGP